MDNQDRTNLIGNVSLAKIAEWEIQRAMLEGKFDHLPGFGQPIPDLDEPVDENWWLRRKLRDEKIAFSAPGLRLRRDVELALEQIWGLPCETTVREAVAALNEKIRRENYNITWGPPSNVSTMDVADVLAQWRARR